MSAALPSSARTWLYVLVACLLTPVARAQPGPGFALRFNDAGSYVAVPHTIGLSAFPLTVTRSVGPNGAFFTLPTPTSRSSFHRAAIDSL